MTYDDWKLRSDRDDSPQPEPESWCDVCQHADCADCPCCSEPAFAERAYRLMEDAAARVRAWPAWKRRSYGRE